MAQPESHRLFFALWPDSKVKSELAAQISILRRNLAGRWIAPDQLHMTLAFLGPTPAVRLAELLDIAGSCRAASFPLNLEVLEFWRKPAILCLTPSRVPDDLWDLAESLGAKLKLAKFPWEARPYRPHLTIARKVSGEVRDGNAPLPAFHWQVDRFSLVESVAGGGGSSYRLRGSWILRGES
jgi:RNA 2',3'-cyclic 3'-phosphodiesterase